LTGPENCEKAIVEAKAEVEAKVADFRERATRWQAEAEDVRQRTERRAEMRIHQERQRLLTRLLEVADNLERALAHADVNDPLRAGVQLTLDDLRSQLAQEGVEPIQALGQSFDPNFHEAIATDGTGGETVAQVLQTGYMLDGVLLRPARVILGEALA
jgi:molecular chaperone GrpE